MTFDIIWPFVIFAVKLCSALNGQAVIYLHDPACYFAVWQTHRFRFSSHRKHFSALRRCLLPCQLCRMPVEPPCWKQRALDSLDANLRSKSANNLYNVNAFWKTVGICWYRKKLWKIMENHGKIHHFHGKIHYKWWFSIVIGILYLAWCPWKNTSTKESAANLASGGTAHRLRLEEGHGHGDNGDYHASAPAFEEIHPSAPPEVLVLNGGCRGDRIHVDTKRWG